MTSAFNPNSGAGGDGGTGAGGIARFTTSAGSDAVLNVSGPITLTSAPLAQGFFDS